MLFKSVFLAMAISLASAQDPSDSQVGRPCGFKIAPCPDDMKCVPDRPGCPNINICPGHCEFKNRYPSCGGFRPRPHKCNKNSECKDDPRLPPNCGMACDAPGICIPKDAPICGGIAGFACPDGLFCYDELDDCDPNDGGVDCIGICL
ncbi:hypothetical protein Trco_007919 [Trichoderma cornu-damae]|uniref:SSCRP protein n=1 Tax=Trichoderma cornu-damae TaxID=654480 RepID=A0A9P8TTK0_9HYPO|nr:hypothetical protein Trco_007919 [Trichoderma cornu-damae]